MFFFFLGKRMMSLNEWHVWYIDGQKYCLSLTTYTLDVTFCFGSDGALRAKQTAGCVHQKLKLEVTNQKKDLLTE